MDRNVENHAVILATGGYDHTIRFWEALSGICYRTIQYPESVSLINFKFMTIIFFIFIFLLEIMK